MSDSAPSEGQSEGVDLTKDGAAHKPEEPFDPYRFGRPEHPIPAEYAPPGYTGPTTSAPPPSAYGTPPPPSGYPGAPDNPFNNAPGTPYGSTPPPYGYNVPPPPRDHGYPMPSTGNGKAVAALVFGILSIVLCVLSFFDGIFVVLGLVFGIIALSESKDGRSGGRGLAIAGLVCTLIGALLAIVLTVLIVHAANDCGGFDQGNTEQLQTCVRDNLF